VSGTRQRSALWAIPIGAAIVLAPVGIAWLVAR
jgi:hypothetical protein